MALKKRENSSLHNFFSAVDSHITNTPTNTGGVGPASISGPSANVGAAEPREIQQSPDPRYPDIGDDSTYVNNDEDLDLGQHSESDVVTSTSPPASARIERVSHNPRFFDSPRDANIQQANTEHSLADDDVPVARRFLDKQRNAGVVSPISQLDSQSAEKRHTVLGKRAQSAVDSSDESDNEFQVDSHDIDPRRRVEKPQQSLPAAKRPRPQDNIEYGNKQGDDSSHRQTSTQVTRRAQTAGIADDTDDEVAPESLAPRPSTQSRWQTANLEAASRNQTARKTNYRWTDEEDERLIYLMGIWGTSFAAIKKQDGGCPASEGGPLLERRSQTNCKDRARNLKRKYIR